MKESFWATEDGKVVLPAHELAETYGSIDFGERLEFVTATGTIPLKEEVDIRAFLNEHYDADIMHSARWLLKRVVIRFTLRHRQSRKIVAFVACLEVPIITLPSEATQKVLLATMLCITRPLRNTGLVKKFLAASIQATLCHGYSTRIFTTTAHLGMGAAATCTRYSVYPESPKSAIWPELAVTRSLKDVFTNVPPIPYSISWQHIVNPRSLDLAFLCAKTENQSVWAATILLRQNSNEYQILLLHTDYPEDPLVLPWIATQLRSMVLYDGPGVNIDKAQYVTDYKVYLHNMDSQNGTWKVPMV